MVLVWLHSIFGKVGRVASESVIVELLRNKCLPILLYGTEACPVSKARSNLLNYVMISSFGKIFNVCSSAIAMECMSMFDYCAISDIIVKRKRKFLRRYGGSDSIVCIACNEFVIKDLSGLEDTT